jgi:hypothetical protein
MKKSGCILLFGGSSLETDFEAESEGKGGGETPVGVSRPGYLGLQFIEEPFSQEVPPVRAKIW